MKTVLISASPKKKFSVSSHFISLCSIGAGGEKVRESIRTPGDHARVLEALRGADSAVFSMPLYVDGVPSHMLDFMEKAEKFFKENDLHPKIYVISNSGFIEGNQSRCLMKIMENFCAEAGCEFCGGVGIGGGVMLNVMRIVLMIYIGIFILNVLLSGIQSGNWLPADAVKSLAEQALTVLFFSAGAVFYLPRLGMAASRGKNFGVKFTRATLPSFLFILAADIFFTVISVFKGGFFRGWLKEEK
ncbi:MAG: hypothetical protein NC120_01880 [Ruminococcus sp.]|nr:hypothetical protein [Ruminococcus sp.]